jgi:deoxycytidine triphosphate deaminase
VILSDIDLRKALAEGRISIEPFDEADVQPSSVDLHVDRYFRVFHNARYPFIDVKKPMEELTELVEVSQDEPFILHPGEFVLGSTAEYVKLPTDLVARLEGKSSLGRLGLLIHSSLPGDEEVFFRHRGTVMQLPIRDIVRKRLEGDVVSFDPTTFEVGYHSVTGWHETAADRIFEVRLASGRHVRLTGGHSLFTLDSDGNLVKVRVHELAAGSRVAIAGSIPDSELSNPRLNLVDMASEDSYSRLVCGGPSVTKAFKDASPDVERLLRDAGYKHVYHYRNNDCLPLAVALQLPELSDSLGASDWLAAKGGKHRLPVFIEVDADFAWLLGLYVAEGSRRRSNFTLSNTNQAILDRAQSILARLDLPVYRAAGAITCCSAVLALLMEWLEIGRYALDKRVPYPLLGWPRPLLESFLEGFVDGDGSREGTRTSLWTSSYQLVGDLLLLCARLGKRAGASVRERKLPWSPHWQISVPHKEHKLLTSVPECSSLLINIRNETGLDQKTASQVAGFNYPTQLNNVERMHKPLKLKTLRTLRDAYAPSHSALLSKLDRLIDGDVLWDVVVSVGDSDEIEPVFDLEVRPSGRRIENFLAGRGGVFVANTAGYVDPGFEGHLTLELSNVANLPITIYPGMKIGQISFFQLTSEAENPYGSGKVRSKYQGQKGPTPSRYHENFKD